MSASVRVGGQSVDVVEPDGALWPPEPAAPVLAISRVKTRVDRRIIEAWAEALRAAGWNLTLTNDITDAIRSARANDLIVPVGIAWLPISSAATARAGELAAGLLGGWARGQAQGRIFAKNPRRCRVLVGEPACFGELRSRWNERSGKPGQKGADFAAFVARQADITLHRSELRIRGDRYRSPRAVVDEVMTSRGFSEGLERLCATLSRSDEGVVADVRAYLDEMASEQHKLVVDLWARWARRLYSGAYQLRVDQTSLACVRELGTRHPLVFLPSHRSNLDPYVMASLLYENGMAQNHTLGGINMAFWPIGPLGRRVGVVFIRRSFRDNEVYRFTLRRYLGFLVSKRFNLEWYIEGGRSRTGKLLPPRLGLLTYLADAVEESSLDDLYAVPTAIVYDLLHEAKGMTTESKGHAKRGEGLAWLLRYAWMQRGDLGSVHVKFGEPVNLGKMLRNLSADDGSADNATRRLARSKIGFEICVRINRATLVTAPAVLLFALLGADDRALTLQEVDKVTSPVLAYVLARGIPLADDARDLASINSVEQTLEHLVRHDLVESYAGGIDRVYRVGPNQEMVAAFYRNSIIHWFVTRSILEVALLAPAAAGSSEDSIERAWTEALRLRDLLKFEFFFPEKREFREELLTELALVTPDLLIGGTGLRDAGRSLAASPVLVANRTLRSFVEAYSIVADHLAMLGTEPAEPFLTLCNRSRFRSDHMLGLLAVGCW